MNPKHLDLHASKQGRLTRRARATDSHQQQAECLPMVAEPGSELQNTHSRTKPYEPSQSQAHSHGRQDSRNRIKEQAVDLTGLTGLTALSVPNPGSVTQPERQAARGIILVGYAHPRQRPRRRPTGLVGAGGRALPSPIRLPRRAGRAPKSPLQRALTAGTTD